MRKHLLAFLVPLFLAQIPLSAHQEATLNPSSWSQSYASKKGEVVVFWYTSNPFIFEDQKGDIVGIEPAILEEFKKYLKKKFDVDLTIHYVKSGSFIETYFNARDNNRSGVFGASAFSITEQRKAEVNFSKPYMPDISVLVTNNKVPIVNDKQDFTSIFKGLKAITVKGTTYENDLLRVREEWGVDFEIQYISSNHNILNTIANNDNSFGFIDLPIYLIQLQNNPSIAVHRQNLLPVKREGYAFMLPKNSDWLAPMNEFLASEDFQAKIKDIASGFIDPTLYNFIEEFYSKADNNTLLVVKEQEMHYEDRLAQETIMKYYLITALVAFLFFGAIVFYLYIKRYRNHQILAEQSEQIALQAENIERQKAQLEKRNSELTHLNEEKNTLIKVLAHDLRSPINQIQGFSNIVLLETKNLSADQITYLHQIKDITVRVNKMIGKILDVDALESGRVNLIMEELHPGDLIKHVITTFAHESDRKEIDIEFINHVANPDFMVELDRVYATQIIENLISNALKFSNNGTRVTIELEKEDDNIKISVKDEGPGFTDEDKKRLFEKFQQLSAKPTSGEKSTGLGLSIVKKFVDLMNGKVWCESTEGKGATFYLVFPIRQDAKIQN